MNPAESQSPPREGFSICTCNCCNTRDDDGGALPYCIHVLTGSMHRFPSQKLSIGKPYIDTGRSSGCRGLSGRLDPDMAWAFHLLGIRVPSILDLGTGRGTQAIELARLGFDVTGDRHFLDGHCAGPIPPGAGHPLPIFSGRHPAYASVKTGSSTSSSTVAACMSFRRTTTLRYVQVCHQADSLKRILADQMFQFRFPRQPAAVRVCSVGNGRAFSLNRHCACAISASANTRGRWTRRPKPSFVCCETGEKMGGELHNGCF